MRIVTLAAATLALGALSACNNSAQEQAADNVEANAENTADMIEANTENVADTLEANGQNAADAYVRPVTIQRIRFALPARTGLTPFAVAVTLTETARTRKGVQTTRTQVV